MNTESRLADKLVLNHVAKHFSPALLEELVDRSGEPCDAGVLTEQIRNAIREGRLLGSLTRSEMGALQFIAFTHHVDGADVDELAAARLVAGVVLLRVLSYSPNTSIYDPTNIAAICATAASQLDNNVIIAVLAFLSDLARDCGPSEQHEITRVLLMSVSIRNLLQALASAPLDDDDIASRTIAERIWLTMYREAVEGPSGVLKMLPRLPGEIRQGLG